MEKKYDITIFGIDISDVEKHYDYDKYTRSNIYIKGNTIIENFNEENFDLIFCYDLIEHLRDVSSFMKNIKFKLNKNGVFMFTIPNKNSLSYYNDYDHQDIILLNTLVPLQHLNEFSLTNISLFSYKNGFKIKELYSPGVMDVDCISSMITNDEDLNSIKNLFETFNINQKMTMQKYINLTNTGTYIEIFLELI